MTVYGEIPIADYPRLKHPGEWWRTRDVVLSNLLALLLGAVLGAGLTYWATL